jgi:hypothetical protein
MTIQKRPSGNSEEKKAQEFIEKAPDSKKITRLMRGNKVQITLTMDEILLNQTDVMAKQLGVSRAALVGMALKQVFEIGLKLGRTES